MVRIMLHGRCQAGGNWVDWHGRAYRSARAQLQASWGFDPTTAPVACAAGGVARFAARPACSVVGRALRWRLAAAVQCLHSSAAGHFGALGQRRRGRFRRTLGCARPRRGCGRGVGQRPARRGRSSGCAGRHPPSLAARASFFPHSTFFPRRADAGEDAWPLEARRLSLPAAWPVALAL